MPKDNYYNSTRPSPKGCQFNSSLAKVAVQCSAVRQLAEANQTLVLRINPDSYRDGKNRHLLLAVNRYGQFL